MVAELEAAAAAVAPAPTASLAATAGMSAAAATYGPAEYPRAPQFSAVVFVPLRAALDSIFEAAQAATDAHPENVRSKPQKQLSRDASPLIKMSSLKGYVSSSCASCEQELQITPLRVSSSNLEEDFFERGNCETTERGEDDGQ